MLEGVHARRGFVDLPREGDGALEDRGEALAVLDPGLRVLVLDDERRLVDVERKEFASGELVVEPVDRAILEVCERIVPRRSGQLVLAQNDLLLPGVQLVRRVREGAPSFQSPRSTVWPP